MTNFVLYNPIAGHGANQGLDRLKEMLQGDLVMTDATKIASYADFIEGLAQDDRILIAGGDGTLNRFVNGIGDLEISNEILYYPVGSGNDFAHDLGYAKGCRPFAVNEYIRRLPRAVIEGRTYRFLNGVGFGLDGYVCHEGNEQRKRTGRPVNYIMVAIKGLLYGYKPTNAKVTVDGVTREYKKVWLAPSMLGKYFGGGMMIAPGQSRSNEEHTVSSVVYSGRGKLFTLCIFPTIYKGMHVRFKKNVIIHTGHEITVEFDKATALQIDGEIIPDVKKYSVTAGI